MKLPWWLVLAGALLLGSAPILADDGKGSGGGGGTVIRFAGQSSSFLLDRLSVYSGIADVRNPGIYTAPACPPGGAPAHGPELGPLLPRDQQAIAIAHDRLKDWKIQLYENWRRDGRQDHFKMLILTAMIDDAIDNMAFHRTTRRFNILDRYVLDPTLAARTPPPTIETAIYYHPWYGAIVSTPVWDCLDPGNQAGLIIHEALRQVQGEYQFHDLRDDQLQALTTYFLDVPPNQYGIPNGYLSRRLSITLENLSSLDLRLLNLGRLDLFCDPRAPGLSSQKLLSPNPLVGFENSLNQLINAQQVANAVRARQNPQTLLQYLLSNGILK